MISPNKQNLLLLKKKAKLTANGHKLLTEKRNGLILNFLEISRRGKELEKQLADKINGYLSNYKSVSMFVSTDEFLSALTKYTGLSLVLQKKKVSGVYISSYELAVNQPSREKLKPALRDVLNQFGPLFKEILLLSQAKNNAQNMAEEIHKTNRQIANLDQKQVEIATDIKYIKAALMEKENYEKSVLMKIFN